MQCFSVSQSFGKQLPTYDIWDRLSNYCDILDKWSNDYNLLDRLSNDYDIDTHWVQVTLRIGNKLIKLSPEATVLSQPH